MWQLYNLEEHYLKHPHVKREDVLKLSKWIESQLHLPVLSEHEVLLFLQACNYSMEYTKQVIDACFTFRTHNEDFFGNMDIETPQMKLVQKTVAGFPLAKRTPEGYAVTMGKLIDIDPANFDFVGSLKLYCMAQDLWLLENGPIPGFTIVIDVTGASFGHIARVGIMQLKAIMYFLQEAIPSRLVSMHFINASPIIDKIMTLITPFLKKELLKQIHVHSTLESFYKFIPRDILPQEYGGPEMDSKDLREIFYKKLRENRLEIIEYNNKHKINEKLRQGKAKNASNLFGTEGNFKKLDID